MPKGGESYLCFSEETKLRNKALLCHLQKYFGGEMGRHSPGQNCSSSGNKLLKH